MKVASPPFTEGSRKNSGNIIMDNPNVSMSDLFVDFRKSFEKYEKKQNLAKQKRLARRNGKNKNDDAAEKKPLFGSLLTPQWNSNSGNGKAPSRDRSKEASAQRCLSLLTGNIGIGKPTPSSASSIKPLETASSAPSYAKSVSNISEDSNGDNEEGGEASIPEYVPLCERRRRSEKAALEKLRAMQSKEPKFKPLLFSKASFNLPGSKDEGDKMDEGSSSSAFPAQLSSAARTVSSSGMQESISGGRKRKASETEPINGYQGLGSMRPISGAVALSTSAASSLPPNGLPSSVATASTTTGSLPPAGHEPLTSSSSVFSYGGTTAGAYSYPYHKRTWTEEEVDGLLGFANRWITPGMSKKRRKG